MPFTIETFGSGHSLVTNKLDPRIHLAQLEKIERPAPAISSFGLFESSTPDFNKYFPEVTAKDLSPEEEDFATPVFRALSKIIINKYGPIDFSMGTVLEDSAPMLVGQAVFTNHDQIVGNEVGVIAEAYFEKARTYDGVKIPGGINVKTKLDGKSNPKLVRSIMMEPPAVHSTSVTVAFEWEQSHPNLTSEDFWRLVGTLDEKGKLIRRVATKIARYEELSLVSHGADPFAQKVGKDGKIVNPQYAGKVYKFSEGDNRKIFHFMDWKTYGSIESFSLDDTIPAELKLSNKPTVNFNHEKKPMNEQLLKFLREILGLDAAATEEQVTAKLQSEFPLLVADRASLSQVRTQLTQAQTELTGIKQKYPEGSTVISKEDQTKLAQFDAMKASYDSVVSETRNRCLKFYHLSVGGETKADAAITKLIAEANLESLKALTAQYEAVVEKEFSASCNDCGSKNVTRASSADRKPGTQGQSDDPSVVKNTKDVAAAIHREKTKPSASFIHGK